MSNDSPSQPTVPQVRRRGITVLHGDLNSRLDIVFLHGLNGDPVRTWTHSESNFFWPWELRNHVRDARIMVFGYDTDITSGSGTDLVRIKGLAEALLGSLTNKRQEGQEPSRPLIFIGHSLGGLVIKQALFLASQSLNTMTDDTHLIYHSTKGIIFFGTPHLGSDADRKRRVKMLKMIGRASFTRVPPNIESALKLHSDELCDLADNFRKTTLWTDRVLDIYTYYETRTNPKLGDKVVDEVSSKIGYDRETSQAIQADHQNMVKFRDEEDDGFDNVCGKVKKLRRHVLSSPRVIKQAYRIPSYPPSSMEPVKTFVERAALLNQIRDQLFRDTESSTNEARIVGVWGSGGAGKSQLARSIVQQHCNTYDSTFWIQGGDLASISRDYLHIYDSLPDKMVKKAQDPDVEEARLAVLRAFTENSGRWLMVIDEVDSLSETDENFVNIRRYIPSNPNIHVIITSRSALVRDLSTFEGVEVGALHLDEAVELFFRCAKIQERGEADQEANARLIVEDLGCLALGISVAGSYISQTPSLSSNLARYREEHQQRLDQLLQEQPREMIDMYGKNLMTTWEASFSAVERRSPDACNIFTILSFFHHEDIFPTLLIKSSAQGQAVEALVLESWLALGFQADVRLHDVERWLSILKAYSLIQHDSSRNSYSIHSLLHTWCRTRLLASKDQEPCHFNLAAVSMLLVANKAPPDAGIRRLNPHLRECVRATNRLQLGSHDESIASQLRDAVVGLNIGARRNASTLLVKVMDKAIYYHLSVPERSIPLLQAITLALELNARGEPYEAVRVLELEGTTEIDYDETPTDTNYILAVAIATARQGEQMMSVFKFLSQRFQAMFAESLRELKKARSNRERRRMVKTAEVFIRRVDDYLGGGDSAVITIPTVWMADGNCPRLGSKNLRITCTTAEDAEQLHSILDADFCKAWLEFCDVPVVIPDSECEQTLLGLFFDARCRVSRVTSLTVNIEDRRHEEDSRRWRDSAGMEDPSTIEISLWQRFKQLLDRE